MSTATGSHVLAALLPDWKLLLQNWASDGSLRSAALEALLLPEAPAALQELEGQWAQAEFSGLPPIVLLSPSEISGAGAYAISTGTIFLNAEWLQRASAPQVLAVLTEELGHHLDGLLNASDTPGDEGELFAALLMRDGRISPEERQAWRLENDGGTAWGRARCWWWSRRRR